MAERRLRFPRVPRGEDDRNLKTAFIRWAELAGLNAIVIAQPIFDALSDSPDSFTSLQFRGLEVFVFAALLLLVAPALLLLVESGAGLIDRRAPFLLHACFIGAFVGLAAWQAAGELAPAVGGIRGAVLLVAAAATAALYLRSDAVRQFVQILGFATPVVFGVLLFSPAGNVAFGDDTEAATVEPRNPAPVVFIVFDELPLAGMLDEHGQVDRARFPNLAQLADKATWYADHQTVSDSTLHAIPSMLTGQNPDLDSVPTASDHPENLLALLRDDYELNVEEFVTDLCPRSECEPRQPFMDRVLGLIELGTSASAPLPRDAAARLTRKVSNVATLTTPREEIFPRAVARMDDEGQPDFNYVHVELPHVVWEYLPDGTKYELAYEMPGEVGIAGYSEGDWTTTRQLADLGLQRFTLQLEYTDSQLGLMLDALERQGIYDDALIVVTADHGAAFTPGASRRMLKEENAGWIAPVPLIVKAPGQRQGRTVSRLTRSTIVAKLVSEALGFELPSEPDLDGPPAEEGSLAFDRWPGGRIEISRRDLKESFDEAVAARNALLDSGDFALADRAWLLGKRAGGLSQLRPVDSELLQPDRFQSVSRAAPYQPAIAAGTVSSPAVAEGDPLAVVVNGVVSATTTAYELDGQTSYAVTLDPGVLKDGANSVEVWRILSGPSGSAAQPGRAE